MITVLVIFGIFAGLIAVLGRLARRRERTHDAVDDGGTLGQEYLVLPDEHRHDSHHHHDDHHSHHDHQGHHDLPDLGGHHH